VRGALKITLNLLVSASGRSAISH